MATDGFWTDGPDEHRCAVEKHIAVLRKRLENYGPEDRERIARELEQALAELEKSDDGQILW